MTLTPGARVGPYEVVSAIGAGGMGEVYRARDTRLGRDVALKVLPAPFAADPDRLRRLEQEARAASALNHPNVLTIFDVGHIDGEPFVASEFVAGETLRARLTRGRSRFRTRSRSRRRLRPDSPPRTRPASFTAI